MQRITYIMLKTLLTAVLWTAAAGGVVSLFTSCETDDVLNFDPETEDVDVQYYMQLVVNVDENKTTRADNPWGGEGGNETMGGILNEGKVHDATVFLFSKNFYTAMNDERIDHVVYFENFTDKGSGKWTATAKLSDEQIEDIVRNKNNRFYAIVVANAGAGYANQYLNNTDDGGTSTPTFDELRNDTIRDVIKTTSASSIPAFDRFVMTSEAVSPLYTFEYDGTSKQPYVVGEIKIQRLAARVDVKPNDATWQAGNSAGANAMAKGTGYLYNVWKRIPNASGGYTYTQENCNDQFLLTDIWLSNSHTGGTWLAKRTAASLSSGAPDLFGTETANSSHVATNYVLSCNSAGVAWGKHDLLLQELAWKPSGTEKYDYFIAGYTEENTDPNHVTTLHFKGIYKKQKKNSSGELIEEYDYDEITYEYKIRHSDPTGDGSASDPMHFGIVRNNIYRIKIDKIVKSDLEHVAVVLYYQNSSGRWVQQDVNIDTDIKDDPASNSAATPNDAPWRR